MNVTKIVPAKPYEVQLDRVKRWKDEIERKLEDINRGNYKGDKAIFFDMIFAFFVFCYHIKDYIENDNSLLVTKVTLNEFIKNNYCLRICYDLCIGTKHLVINHPKTTGGTLRININYKLNRVGNKVIVSLQSKTVNQEFSDLADECIQKWEEFIKTEVS